jgi:hypothetical protein
LYIRLIALSEIAICPDTSNIMSDSEEDFMSDKFLQAAAAKSKEQDLTYAQKRQKAQNAAYDRGRVLSRKEKEHLAREEGLSKNLITETRLEDDQRGSNNKALAMMAKMGFKPGQALGKASLPPSTTPSSSTAPSKARIIPIELNLRTGKLHSAPASRQSDCYSFLQAGVA